MRSNTVHSPRYLAYPQRCLLYCLSAQGYAYFPELQSAYAAFPAAVGPLVAACSAALKEQAVAAAAPGSTIRRYHAAHGINVEAW